MKIKLLFLFVFFAITACKDDPCKDMVCQNNSSCNSGTCLCSVGYEGSDCSIEIRSKLLGANGSMRVYFYVDSCVNNLGVSDTSSGIVQINSSSQNVTEVIITNVHNVGSSTNLYANIDSTNRLTFAPQTWQSTGTISGWAQFSNNLITGEWYYSNVGIADTCFFTWQPL